MFYSKFLKKNLTFQKLRWPILDPISLTIHVLKKTSFSLFPIG